MTSRFVRQHKIGMDRKTANRENKVKESGQIGDIKLFKMKNDI